MIAEIFCIIYYILSMLQTVPCVYKLVKTKSSDDYSLLNRLCQYTALICFTIYICLADTEVLTKIIGFVDLGLLTLENILILSYRKWK